MEVRPESARRLAGRGNARLGHLSRRDRTVITVCGVGDRCGMAAQMLAGDGFMDAHDLKGGLLAWRAADY